ASATWYRTSSGTCKSMGHGGTNSPSSMMPPRSQRPSRTSLLRKSPKLQHEGTNLAGLDLFTKGIRMWFQPRAMPKFRKLFRSAERVIVGSAQRVYASRVPPFGYRSADIALSLTAAAERFAERNSLYHYMHYWFARSAPEWLRQHRWF